ncbi:unnamed protein product [Owenia fusiformis]|uniref:Uncharacterized protein n=1 Tax=Owenia fusiformis TaxID=6347 RepID=A0A8S4PQ78_OWEFU|nr:unnamed protein product [Owenia fusiformis]
MGTSLERKHIVLIKTTVFMANFCLESNYSVWSKSDGKCKLCSMNVPEDSQHRLLLCEHFKEERESFFYSVCKQCPSDLFSNINKCNLTEKLTFPKWGQDYFRLFDSIVKRHNPIVQAPRFMSMITYNIVLKKLYMTLYIFIHTV